MTETTLASSHQRRRPSVPTGPLTRSAVAARTDVPLSTTTTTSSSCSSSSSSSGPPPPPEHAEESLRRPITRKRAASINTEEANQPKVEVLRLGTPSTASPHPFDASAGRICLCTPAPKIPRPRNAFILYRQHHQARVVQQNPGLANPEISKIIGEQWRAESEEAKNQWKLLAEEEKQRHQRQHPDYRYQPRRGNKAGSFHSSRPAPSEDLHHCPRCGGRYIATPKTPSTPFMTPTISKIGSTSYGSPPGGHSLGSRGDMSRQNRSHPEAHWGAATSNPYSSNTCDVHDEYEAAMSPNEVKRRRYNTATGSYHTFHALSSPSAPITQPAATAAAAVATGAETGLGILHPTPTIPSYGATTAGGGEGEVKRERDVAAERTHARSVEAMVMSISFVSKLRVLERISPPLGAVPGALGSGTSRGPVIAVEGPDARTVRAVSRVVERALRAASSAADEKGAGWEVRCWEDANAPIQRRGSASGEQSDTLHGSQVAAISSSAANLNPFTAYLRTIADWHAKSAEIVQFVTSSAPAPASTATRQTRILSTSSAATTASRSSSFAEGTTERGRIEAEREDESAVRPSHRRALPPGSADAAAASRTTTSSTDEQGSRLPIALLPSGFSLTLSDRFASAIPISDAYAPVDHWQWMATLWRGIVGPDLVIYVSGPSTMSPGSVAGKDASPALGGGGIGIWNGSVEIKNEGLMVVKIPAAATVAASSGGSGNCGPGRAFAEADGMMIDEKLERRLGFEVVEWVRSGGWTTAGRY
ncbi:hypothetical protein VTH06DRAFT_5084 [Thermothelomyces fergusii]